MTVLYDLQEIRDMSGNDQEFINEFLQLFIKNNREYLKEMNQAFELKNWAQVKFCAHKIKPSIMVIHAEALNQPILDLNEFAGKQENLEKIPSLMGLLNTKLLVIFNALKDEIK